MKMKPHHKMTPHHKKILILIGFTVVLSALLIIYLSQNFVEEETPASESPGELSGQALRGLRSVSRSASISRSSSSSSSRGSSSGDVTFYVDNKANSRSSDGSSRYPFTSLGSAFSKLARGSYTSATIHVASGTYSEGTLTIGQDTVIQGPSSGTAMVSGATIKNTGAHSLKLSRLSFISSKISVDNPSAETAIEDVTMTGSLDNAILQDGGTLKLSDVSIKKTARGSYARGTEIGTGILLRDGVKACLNDVTLSGNSNGALRIADTGTKVYAEGVSVTDNTYSGSFSTWTTGLGAVEVRNGALLLMEDSVISKNEMIGLAVYDAKAHFRKGVVSYTKMRSTETVAVNLGVKQTSAGLDKYGKSELEVSEFSSTSSDMAGMMSNDGWLKASDGMIKFNKYGLVIQLPEGINPPNIVNCFNDVEISSNTEKDLINEGPLPIPPPPPMPGEESKPEPPKDYSTCADVPFSPYWC